MAIIALKAWYLREYEPIRELEKRPQDLRLSKNSLLKSALRADFLDDSDTVKESEWFQRYLQGEPVEFYIEGSGGYAIANVDLISHELYFVKRDVLSHLDPIVFFCYQTEYEASSIILRDELIAALTTLNKRSRIPLKLEESHRPSDAPLRLSSTLLRKLRRSLIFVADGTTILSLESNPPQLFPSPKVCVELGYALQCKRSEQLLVVQMDRQETGGQFPFDVPLSQKLVFQTQAELKTLLLPALEAQMKQFSLL
ncbi:MAG: hypothetical protein ACO3EZ_02480 [Prochlorotrichaceae cyanobacterium]